MGVVTKPDNAAFETALEYISSGGKTAVLCHTSPDGDTLGAGFALCGLIKQLGQDCVLLCDEDPGPLFKYLYHDCAFEYIYGDRAVTEAEKYGKFIVVDTADVKLLGKLARDNIGLAFDHHVTNTGFADYTILGEGAAAACEVIYEFGVWLEEKGRVKLDDMFGAAVYTGIATDTGCYRFSNVTPQTMRIGARLMERFPLDYGRINHVHFDMKTSGRASAEYYALKNIEYYHGGRVALVSIPLEIMSALEEGGLKGIAGLPRQIEGVVCGIFMKEKERGVWRVSVRTGKSTETDFNPVLNTDGGNADVYKDADVPNAYKICAELGGGGHIRAAGCKINGSFEEVREKLLAAAEKYL